MLTPAVSGADANEFVLALQDDIQIEHLEHDEAQREAEVDQKIIRQVDDLVAYFNSLYQDDQIDIV